MTGWLTVDEFAALMKLTPKGVRMRIRKGRIKAKNVGTQHRHIYRIPASEAAA